ncbi:MAG: SpoIVB peptidase [Clostridia bacterium]
MKNVLFKIFLCLIIVAAVFSGFNLSLMNIEYTDSMILTEDFSALEPSPPISLCVNHKDNGGLILNYKLFNFLDIKTLNCRFVENEEVYLGGKPLGVTIGAEGAIIVGTNAIITDKGLVNPLVDSGIQNGDILMSINGYKVNNPSDITKIANYVATKNVKLKINRRGNIFEVDTVFLKDTLTGEPRLGLSIKDCISGIGTLTYIKSDGSFGALGHHIIDTDTGLSKELNTGRVYNCSIIGVKKGVKGAAGELRGVFNRFDNGVGSINNNNEFGIFGKMSEVGADAQKIKVGSELDIKHGKAYVYTTVNGNAPDYYEINIVKTMQQDNAQVKSMVISITDKRLLDITGGIVQGMSGSPVIQNGKLIGAVTHVFINDPTRGYAVYINWMLSSSCG